MLFAFIVVVVLCVCAQSEKLDLSELLGGEGDGQQSQRLNLQGRALDILKSIDLGDLERDLEETSSGIREGAAELVKEQLHKVSHTVPQMEMDSSALPALSSRKRPSSAKSGGSCHCGSSSSQPSSQSNGQFSMQEVMASSSRKLKRAMAARLLKAASQLLGTSSSSRQN